MTREAYPINTALSTQRKLRGWSQAKLAELIGASEEMISKWERGKKRTSPYYQEKLCDLFGKNAEELGFLLPTSVEASGKSIFALPVDPQIREDASSLDRHLLEFSEASVTNLSTITHQFRMMQRRGDAFISNGVNAHIQTVQSALEQTVDDGIRHELWRVLAQTQIVAGFNPMKKTEQGRAKTFLETAVASAQNRVVLQEIEGR